MELQDLIQKITPLNEAAMTAARQRQAQLAKPPESLGRLEDLSVQLAGITGQVHTCASGEIDFSKKCIYKIEEFTCGHPDPVGYFKAHREQWQDSILILQDIFCGVVPMGAENRAWRQNTGRLAQYLSKEATRVSRIFCGLEQRLK